MPVINQSCKLWDNLYIAMSPGPDGDCYIYKEAAIRYTGPTRMPGWGDHFTVGMRQCCHTRKMLFTSQLSLYTKMDHPDLLQLGKLSSMMTHPCAY